MIETSITVIIKGMLLMIETSITISIKGMFTAD